MNLRLAFLVMINIRSFTLGFPILRTRRRLLRPLSSYEEVPTRHIHTLQRIHIDAPVTLQHGSIVVLGQEQSHYLSSVLRLRAGQFVRIFNGHDGEWLAALQSPEIIPDRNQSRKRMAKSSVTISIAVDRPCLRPQPKLKNVTLMFSLIKSKQMRLLVEKATELGVTSIWPVISERAQKKNALTDAELGKLRAVATMATEQSERMTVPVLEPVQSLDAALRSFTSTPSASSSTTRALFICEERSENSMPLLDALVEMEASCSPSSQSGHCDANCEPIFLVGPEGGWAEGEVDRALVSLSPNGNPAAEFSTGIILLKIWRVSLGDLILRAETASICSLSVWNSFRDGQSRSSSFSGAQRDNR